MKPIVRTAVWRKVCAFEARIARCCTAVAGTGYAGLSGGDVSIANSDGTRAHRLLHHAENYGWSADGRYILVKWNPSDQFGGLAVVKPDRSEFPVVLPFDADCSPGSSQKCTDGVGWGQA